MSLYLDNAATSWPKPPAVARAATAFLRHPTGNPGRAGHAPATAADRLLDDLRRRMAGLFHLSNARRVVFGLNATDCLNMAIHGVLAGHRPARGSMRRGRRPHVITSAYDHNSVQRPLNALVAAGQIELTRIGRRGEPIWRAGDVRTALRPTTALVVLTHASNVTGAIGDAAAVATLLRDGKRLRRPAGGDRGASDLDRPIFLLDAAQTAGCWPIDFDALGSDLMAMSGHKSLLGPTGTGALLVAAELPPLAPWRMGGTGVDSTAPLQPAELPARLEAGTANTFGLAGLSAAVRFLETRSPAKIAAHEARLRRRLIGRLQRLAGVRLHAAKGDCAAVGVLSLDFGNRLVVSDAAAILSSDFGIAVRSGLHCAPHVHPLIGTAPEGTLRISPGPFNTVGDIDRCARAIGAVLRSFPAGPAIRQLRHSADRQPRPSADRPPPCKGIQA